MELFAPGLGGLGYVRASSRVSLRWLGIRLEFHWKLCVSLPFHLKWANWNFSTWPLIPLCDRNMTQRPRLYLIHVQAGCRSGLFRPSLNQTFLWLQGLTLPYSVKHNMLLILYQLLNNSRWRSHAPSCLRQTSVQLSSKVNMIGMQSTLKIFGIRTEFITFAVCERGLNVVYLFFR